MGRSSGSPLVYQGIRGQKTVEARAGGINSKGGLITALVVKWIPADPTMVTVSPTLASLVKITVRKPGQSRLRMVYGSLSKTLLIKAVSEYGLLLRLYDHPIVGASSKRLRAADQPGED